MLQIIAPPQQPRLYVSVEQMSIRQSFVKTYQSVIKIIAFNKNIIWLCQIIVHPRFYQIFLSYEKQVSTISKKLYLATTGFVKRRKL